jgi:hypothetical protein
MRLQLIDIQMRRAEINQGQGSALMQGLFDVADYLAAGTITGTPSPVATVERVPPSAPGREATARFDHEHLNRLVACSTRHGYSNSAAAYPV